MGRAPGGGCRFDGAPGMPQAAVAVVSRALNSGATEVMLRQFGGSRGHPVRGHDVVVESARSAVICSFADFELDEPGGELRRAGAAVPLQPKVFQLLAYLVEHRERVVTREELMKAIWQGVAVTDWSLSSCVRALRKALGDDGDQQRLIKTIHGRGYRFIASVRDGRTEVPNGQAAAAALHGSPRPDAAAERRPFIGRRQELDRLRGFLQEAIAGRGRTVILAGEGGIGKTRLAREIAALARHWGARVLIGRCYEGEGTPLYWPWIQIVQGYAREAQAAALAADLCVGAEEIAQLVPAIREKLPDLGPATPVEPDLARFRLLDAVRSCILSAARRQPLVLVFDDLHWADRSSLLLLQFLSREVESAPLLVLGTYRDAELPPSHPLGEMIASLCRETQYSRLFLKGLPEGDVRALLTALAGCEVNPELARFIFRITDGNPFFVEELTRHLEESQLIWGWDGDWRSQRTIEQLSVPEGVRVLIHRRLEHLTQPCRQLLATAAVVGRDFSLRVLTRVWAKVAGVEPGQAEEQVLRLLDDALAARIVEPAKQRLGGYHFSHALVCETLIDELKPSERIALHRLVGDCKEQLYEGDLLSHLPELAHHFCEAASAGTDVDRAIAYCRRAAEHSVSLLAYEDAVLHYETALRLLEAGERPDETERCALLLALGEATWRMGDLGRSKTLFLRAAEIARRPGPADHLAQAALGAGRWVEMGIVDAAQVALLAEAIDRVGSSDAAVRARLVASLAHALKWSPDHERRSALAREAIALAQQIGDLSTLAATLASTLAARGPDRSESHLDATERLLELAVDLHDREVLLRGHYWRAVELLELGDVRGFDRELSEYSGLAEELRDPFYIWHAAVHRAMRALLGARFEAAERLAQDALALGQRLDQDDAVFAFGIQIALLRFEQGRHEEIIESINGFVERYPSLPTLRCALAQLNRELARPDEEREEFERLAADDFAHVPRDDGWIIGLGMLGQVCASLGDGRRAAVLYQLLQPYAARCIVMGSGVVCFGSAARYLGLLAATMGRRRESSEHFEHALALHDEMGAPSWYASTQCDYAAMILDGRTQGSRKSALRLLEESGRTANELGMRWLARRVECLQRR